MADTNETYKKTFSTFSNVSNKECRFCTREFSSRTACTRHEAHCMSKESHWICDQCGKTFKTETRLLSHKPIHDASTIKNFECTTCSKVYKSLSDLRKHCEMLSHIYPVVEGPVLDDETRCSVCFRVVKTDHMEFHMKLRHKEDKMHKCDKCSYSTLRKNNYHRHLRYNHNTIPMNFDAIRKHFENNESYTCPKCCKVFVSSTAAEDHLLLKNCDDEDKLVCKLCNIKFTMKQSQKAHMKRKHPETLE